MVFAGWDFASENSPEENDKKWNKISDLIFNKDKQSFRKTLVCINSRLYLEASRNLKRKSVRYVDIDELQRLATQKVQLKKSDTYASDARKKFHSMQSGRQSAVSEVLTEIRNQDQQASKKNKLNGLMATRLLGKFLISRKKASTTKHVPEVKITSSNLESIPERQRAFSMSPKRRVGSKQTDPNLVQRLLHRDHRVFKNVERCQSKLTLSSELTTGKSLCTFLWKNMKNS